MELRPYQVEGVKRAMEHDGFLLICEQRTGKTPMAREVVVRRRPKRLLIACPEIAINVWKAALRGVSGCVTKIVTDDSLWRQRKRLKRWAPDGFIGDEIHRWKSPSARRSRAARSIAKSCSWRLGLTGTPIEENLWDAWALCDFIDPEIFGLWSDFQERYLVKGGFRGHQIIATQHVDEFQRKFHARAYRVELAEVQESPTHIRRHVVKFDLVESRPFYDQMENELIVNLSAEKRVVAPRAITKIMKLHQLSGGFIIDADKHIHRVGNEKLLHAAALVLTIGTPIVIIVRFIPEMYRLRYLLRALGLTVSLISGKNRFTKFDTDAAIVQVQSGMAIDLARAAKLMFYSFDYSYLNYEQSSFRIRSYDALEVDYYYLLARDTVDENIFEAVTTHKRSMAKFLIDKYRRR